MSMTVRLTVLLVTAGSPATASRPCDGRTFQGRIAYSADGNHNDPDDWASSPVALAMIAQAGCKDRLVHFDYNCILPESDAAWERKHAESVLGAAKHYGYDRSLFHDCRQNLKLAVDSIARAINASSVDSPLFFIIAGPMEVPYLGIRKSDPARLFGCRNGLVCADGRRRLRSAGIEKAA